MINSASDDKADFGLLDVAAVATFEVISKYLPGILNTLVANFLPALAELLPKFLKKLRSPSTYIVLSLKVIDFFSDTN